MRRPPYAVPSSRDGVVAAAARVIGGPAGRYAAVGGRGLAGVASALIAMGALVLALGVFQKGHCLTKGWANPDQFWRTCYSDVPVLHVTSGLAGRQFPYLGAAPLDQPLLSGLTMWLLSLVSPRAGTDVLAQQWIFGLWAVLAVLLMAAAVLAGVALRPGRPWQVAHLATSPVLAVLALVSVDLLGIALVLWALLSWRRDHPAWAGILLGLAVLVRPYPLVFLAALVMVALRVGRRREAARVLVAAALAALALFLPFAVAAPEGTLLSLRNWWAMSPGYGAPALVPQLLGVPLPAPATTFIALTGWLLAIVLGSWLTFGPRRPPTLVQVAAPMLLVVLLTSKAVPVQAGLWILPLIALSVVPWRDHLIWAGAECLHFVAVWLHIGFGSDAGKGLPGDTYSLTIAVRFAALAWLVWRIWSGRTGSARILTAGRAAFPSWPRTPGPPVPAASPPRDTGR